MNIFSRRARLGNAWAVNVRLRIAQGKIATIASAAEPQAGDVVDLGGDDGHTRVI